MYKLIFLSVLMLCSSLVASSQAYDVSRADTITKQLFVDGKWDELIETGNNILKEKIDFETLRQRLGYAWLMKGNYLKSRLQYENAL